jgi:hypothetical protein
MRARETDRRKDWAEKTSTDLARRFDVIRVEDPKIGVMTRSARRTLEDPGRNVRAKAGLNRGIVVNAARNIAAGQPANSSAHLTCTLHARGGDGAARPVNREPQLLASFTGRE